MRAPSSRLEAIHPAIVVLQLHTVSPEAKKKASVLSLAFLEGGCVVYGLKLLVGPFGKGSPIGVQVALSERNRCSPGFRLHPVSATVPIGPTADSYSKGLAKAESGGVTVARRSHRPTITYCARVGASCRVAQPSWAVYSR